MSDFEFTGKEIGLPDDDKTYIVSGPPDGTREGALRAAPKLHAAGKLRIKPSEDEGLAFADRPQNKPPPTAMEGALDTAVDVGKALPRGMAKGTMALGGLPGDVRSLAGAGTEALGLGKKVGEGIVSSLPFGGIFRAAPTTQQIRETVEKITGPLGEAKTIPGKYSEKLGEYIPSAMIGPGSILTKLGIAGISSVAGETGALAAKKVGLPEAVGEIPAAMLSGGIATAVTAPAKAARPGLQETMDTFKRLGLISTAATTGVGGRAAALAESNVLRETIGGAGVIERTQKANYEGFIDKQQEIARAYGAPKIKEEAGRIMRDTLEEGYEKTKKEGGRILNAIGQAFGPQNYYPAKNLEHVINNPIGGATSDAVKVTTDSSALKDAAKMLANNGGLLTYQDMKALKSHYAQMLDPRLPKPPGAAQIDQLVFALDHDIEAAVKGLGNPDVFRDWQYAKAIYRNAERDFEQSFKHLIGTKKMPVKGEAVYRILLGEAGTKSPADIAAFETVWRALGKDKQGELAASILSQMGNTNPSQFGSIEGFSLSTFLTNYDKNLSPEAKKMLFYSTGNQAIEKELDDLVFAARKMAVWDELKSTSKSGAARSYLGQATAPALLALSGNLAAAAGMAVFQIGGAHVAAQILTNPAAIRRLSKSLNQVDNATIGATRALLAAEAELAQIKGPPQ